MSNSIESVLAQIRQVSHQHQKLDQANPLDRSLSIKPKFELDQPDKSSGVKPQGDFSQVLHHGINAVNQQQQQASAMAKSFELGTSDRSLAEVMVQAQKADVSFKAMTEVRNKLVDAYREVMQMSV